MCRSPQSKMSNNKSKQSGGLSFLQLGMGLFILFSLGTNFYVIFLFNKLGGTIPGSTHGPPSPHSRHTREDDVDYNFQDAPQLHHGKYSSAMMKHERGDRHYYDNDGDGDFSGSGEEHRNSRRGSSHHHRHRRKHERGDRLYHDIMGEKDKKSKYNGQYKNYPEGTPPKDWKTMGFYDIRHYFDCKGYAHDDKKPLTTLSVYNDMQQKYKEIVIEHPSWDQDPIPPTEGYTLHTDKAGPSPFYADHGEHGRGLFASRDIQMGELVHDGTHSDMVFPTGRHWRAYILSLERRMACDQIDWSWTQKTEKDGEYHVFSTPNISGLFNGGERDQINVNPPTHYSKKFYATRDIQRGEELITDYHVYHTDWKAVGL